MIAQQPMIPPKNATAHSIILETSPATKPLVTQVMLAKMASQTKNANLIRVTLLSYCYTSIMLR